MAIGARDVRLVCSLLKSLRARRGQRLFGDERPDGHGRGLALACWIQVDGVRVRGARFFRAAFDSDDQAMQPVGVGQGGDRHRQIFVRVFAAASGQEGDDVVYVGHPLGRALVGEECLPEELTVASQRDGREADITAE